MTCTLLYSAEVWSGVTEKQLSRLEVVDSSFLRQLTGGHSKCASEFHHLETGTWKLRHILTYLRLLYHHNILNREENETIKKIYRKQKESSVKGDWYNLLMKDFQFIGIDMDEDGISRTSKEEYKKKIKLLVQKAAFDYYMKLKNEHKKLDGVNYQELKIQPYLTDTQFNQKERKLLYSLRSKCHKSKFNFKKMNKNQLFCTFGCPIIEDQIHIFSNCVPILSNIKTQTHILLSFIDGNIGEQKEACTYFLEIEETRLHMMKHLLPGGTCRQDPCKFGVSSPDSAADLPLYWIKKKKKIYRYKKSIF